MTRQQDIAKLWEIRQGGDPLPCSLRIREWAFCNAYTLIFLSAFCLGLLVGLLVRPYV